MNRIQTKMRQTLAAALQTKYLPFTLLVILSVVSLLSRVVLLLR